MQVSVVCAVISVPQISVKHLLVGTDFIGRAYRQDLTFHHDHDAVAQVHHKVHVVLDHHEAALAWAVQLFEQGALFIGAFDASEKLVGVSVVSNQLIADYPHAKLLHYFYVDADHQGQGIGAKLMQAAKESAKQLGADQLYISATPSRRTVDFYMKHGVQPLSAPDQQLWQLEPEDIHLLCTL